MANFVDFFSGFTKPAQKLISVLKGQERYAKVKSEEAISLYFAKLLKGWLNLIAYFSEMRLQGWKCSGRIKSTLKI